MLFLNHKGNDSNFLHKVTDHHVKLDAIHLVSSTKVYIKKCKEDSNNNNKNQRWMKYIIGNYAT